MKAYHTLKNPKDRRFSGEYAEDGKAKRLQVRADAGHRCIRCLHPFKSGEHGKGEWSPCDEQCTHKGPIRIWKSDGLLGIVSNATAGDLVKGGDKCEAEWRILTVHHANGDKADDWWDNLLPLCQRCHLVIQGKVDPRIPWMLEHSAWMKPFAAAWCARKYEGRKITRQEAEERMEELLAYECRVNPACHSDNQT